jgi:hypothetical protein
VFAGAVRCFGLPFHCASPLAKGFSTSGCCRNFHTVAATGDPGRYPPSSGSRPGARGAAGPAAEDLRRAAFPGGTLRQSCTRRSRWEMNPKADAEISRPPVAEDALWTRPRDQVGITDTMRTVLLAPSASQCARRDYARASARMASGVIRGDGLPSPQGQDRDGRGLAAASRSLRPGVATSGRKEWRIGSRHAPAARSTFLKVERPGKWNADCRRSPWNRFLARQASPPAAWAVGPCTVALRGSTRTAVKSLDRQALSFIYSGIFPISPELSD